MLDHLSDALISLIDTYIFYLILCLFMCQRPQNKFIKICCFIIVMILHVMKYFFITTLSPIRFIIFIVIDIVFAYVLFDDKWHKYPLFTALYYILLGAVDIMHLAIINMIMPDFDVFKAVTGQYSLPILISTILSRLIAFFIILIVKLYKNRPIHRQKWWGLLLMPFITIIFAWLVYPRYWALNNQDIENLLMALAIFLVLQNIFVFVYMAVVQSSTERYFAMKEAYERQKQYSTTISTIQKAVRKMAHDIRHHFIYLRSVLDQEDIPKAKAYLNQLDENLENIIPLNVTGHYDVDALLHAKASIAEKLNIHIHVEGILPPELMVSPIDLSALLGNSIDNAIESASRIDGQKEIIISFYYNASRLNYTISNPYNGQLQRNPNGYFVSLKGSGLGFEIMDEVVKKYGGALLTENDDNNFKLTVMLQTNLNA